VWSINSLRMAFYISMIRSALSANLCTLDPVTLRITKVWCSVRFGYAHTRWAVVRYFYLAGCYGTRPSCSLVFRVPLITSWDIKMFFQWCISWIHYDSAEYRERRALRSAYFISWCTLPKFRNLPIAVDVGPLVNFKETYNATILHRTSCMYRLRYTHHRLTKSLSVFPMSYGSFSTVRAVLLNFLRLASIPR
jgi:hypothetical protein